MKLLTKSNFVISIIVTVLSVLVAIVLLTGSIFWSLGSEDSKLEKLAKNKEESLSRIIILDSQPTNAVGEKGGDGLTGRAEPVEVDGEIIPSSVYARAEFKVDGTLGANSSEVIKNLSKAGFKPTGRVKTGESFSKNFSWVEMKYNNGTNTIKTRFYFIKVQNCPEDLICGYDNEFSDMKYPKEKLYDASLLNNETVRKLLVDYQ